MQIDINYCLYFYISAICGIVHNSIIILMYIFQNCLSLHYGSMHLYAFIYKHVYNFNGTTFKDTINFQDVWPRNDRHSKTERKATIFTLYPQNHIGQRHRWQQLQLHLFTFKLNAEFGNYNYKTRRHNLNYFESVVRITSWEFLQFWLLNEIKYYNKTQTIIY